MKFGLKKAVELFICENTLAPTETLIKPTAAALNEFRGRNPGGQP